MKKTVCFICCVVMTFFLAACGQQKDGISAADRKEPAYVPEHIVLQDGEENDYFANFTLSGNCLYYSRNTYDEEMSASTETLYEYSLADCSTREIPIKLCGRSNFIGYILDKNGDIYAVINDYSSAETDEEGVRVPDVLIGKYDSQGSAIFEKDITELIRRVGENAYIQDILVDEQNNIYVCLEQGVLLLNEEGEEHGLVEVSVGRIRSIGLGKDGKVYLCYQKRTSDMENILSEIDFAGRKTGETYHNVPNINGRMSVGTEKDFLLHDGAVVYEYEMATQSYKELFCWLDYDINGGYVKQIGVTKDGVIAAVVGDRDTNITEIVKLNEGSEESVPEVARKEEIVIGALYDSQELQDAVWAFNLASDTCHATIKYYIDSNNLTEISYDDAIININKDLISESACPDILDLSLLNAKQLAAKGAIEDLTPYLEESSAFGKEDFVDHLLEGFTYDGILTTIPPRFNISTVVGKTSDVGTEMGWSLQEMIDFAKEHPDSQLMAGMDQGEFLYYYMMFNQETFVDWSKGECYFDSEEFRTLLEFAGTFPSEIDWFAYSGKAQAEEKQAGEILLERVADVYDFQQMQLYPEMFGEEVTYIGFPTGDGSVGCIMNAQGSLYGITAKSKHKDDAWEFIESYLTGSADNVYAIWGFPALKDKLQEKIDNIYCLDENGERILDENGEPMPVMTYAKKTFDDWEFVYHTPTDEEIGQVMELISAAEPRNSINQINIIISEEAEACFSGQKSIDETVDVIQNRVQTYISENRF